MYKQYNLPLEGATWEIEVFQMEPGIWRQVLLITFYFSGTNSFGLASNHFHLD